jgi:hypothetical protein
MFAAESGKKFWADKTPDYGYFMATLQSMWPECRFIHLIRDGAAVVNSMSRHIGYRALAAADQLIWCPLAFDYSPEARAKGEPSPESFVKLWYWRVIRTRNEATRLEQGTYLEIRYEALVREPAACMAEISSFVGLKAPRSWIEEAVALVDPARASSARPTEMIGCFGEQEERLLEELGYPVLQR